MDELEQTLNEILTPQNVAAYLDVRRTIACADCYEQNLAKVMLNLGTIVREDLMPGYHVCQSCCFDTVFVNGCFEYCAFGEIFHFSEEVRKNLHPQTAKSLKNLFQRKNDL